MVNLKICTVAFAASFGSYALLARDVAARRLRSLRILNSGSAAAVGARLSYRVFSQRRHDTQVRLGADVWQNQWDNNQAASHYSFFRGPLLLAAKAASQLL